MLRSRDITGRGTSKGYVVDPIEPWLWLGGLRDSKDSKGLQGLQGTQGNEGSI